MKNILFVSALAAALFCLYSPAAASDAGPDGDPPVVVSTDPKDGAADVAPSLSEISVIFSEPMQDGGWSWVYEDKATFPKVAGEPRYTDGYRTCVLPVSLEPGREYVIWINSARFTNFRDLSGNPARPYRFRFKTGKR